MEDKVFNLLEKMYSDLSCKIEKMDIQMQEGFKKVNTRLDGVESRLDKVEKTVLNIEDSHGEKLDALFD